MLQRLQAGYIWAHLLPGGLYVECTECQSMDIPTILGGYSPHCMISCIGVMLRRASVFIKKYQECMISYKMMSPCALAATYLVE